MERLLRVCFKERVDNKKIQCYISTRTNRIHNERVKIMVTKTDYYDYSLVDFAFGTEAE